MALSTQYKVCIFPWWCLRKQKREIIKSAWALCCLNPFRIKYSSLASTRFLFLMLGMCQNIISGIQSQMGTCQEYLRSQVGPRKFCAVDLYIQICKQSFEIPWKLLYVLSILYTWVDPGRGFHPLVNILLGQLKEKCEWSCFLRAVTFGRIVMFQLRNSW